MLFCAVSFSTHTDFQGNYRRCAAWFAFTKTASFLEFLHAGGKRLHKRLLETDEVGGQILRLAQTLRHVQVEATTGVEVLNIKQKRKKATLLNIHRRFKVRDGSFWTQTQSACG